MPSSGPVYAIRRVRWAGECQSGGCGGGFNGAGAANDEAERVFKSMLMPRLKEGNGAGGASPAATGREGNGVEEARPAREWRARGWKGMEWRRRGRQRGIQTYTFPLCKGGREWCRGGEHGGDGTGWYRRPGLATGCDRGMDWADECRSPSKPMKARRVGREGEVQGASRGARGRGQAAYIVC